MGIFEKIKDTIIQKKGSKLQDKIIEFINNTVDNEEGMLIPYKIDEATGELYSKQITKEHFGVAFHEEIWNNMYVEQKIVVLMWLDSYFAKKDNRPEAEFELDLINNAFNFGFEKGCSTFSIPVQAIQEELLSYESAREVILLCILAKSLDRLQKFSINEEITDLDKNYLEALRFLSFEPTGYYKLIAEKTLEKQKDILSEEDKAELLKLVNNSLSKDEKQTVLEYLLQPYIENFNEEAKLLDTYANLNDFYIGKDNSYAVYKTIIDQENIIKQEFLEKELAGRDKNQMFIEWLNSKLQAENQVNIQKDNDVVMEK